jgi:hypothetical protein
MLITASLLARPRHAVCPRVEPVSFVERGGGFAKLRNGPMEFTTETPRKADGNEKGKERDVQPPGRLSGLSPYSNTLLSADAVVFGGATATSI